MMRVLCKSKIHKAWVTESNINYEGSITIDRDLMDAADLLPYERVQIANLNTGSRLETYVIEGKRGAGVIGMNGAAAHLAKVGDPVHIMSYASYADSEISSFKPIVIHVSQENKIRTEQSAGSQS